MNSKKTTFGNIYPHNPQSFKYDVKTTFKTKMHRIPISDAKESQTTSKNKIFCSNSAFLGKASCSGWLHTTSEVQVATHICSNKIFPKKIVKFENVNSFLKNVSAEKKLPVDFRHCIYCDNYHPSAASTYPSIQTNY